MKDKLFISLMVILAFCGCQREELKEQTTMIGGKSFTAVIEDDFSNTKTYLDSDGNVLWKAGNQVSIFDGVTINKQYQVSDDSEGKTSATMNLVSTPGYVGGMEIDNNVAFYPYQASASITQKESNYVIDDIELPATQTYAENSFGNGAFPMVAVTSSTSDTFLKFKNILGALQLQLKGTASIVSVSVNGNNNEILCGDASVTAANGNTPSIELTEASAQTVTLDCGAGVPLNSETATSFVIALPPMTMTGGFTVVVTDSEGKEMEIKTTKEQTIVRSKILRMPAVNYVGTASKKPLTFTSTGETTISLNRYGVGGGINIEYKVNDGDWLLYTIGSARGDEVSLKDKDQVSFRALLQNTSFSQDRANYFYFSISGNGTVAASGNIMSLIDKNMEVLTIPSQGICFYNLFSNCIALTTAPELPATTLANCCYEKMFWGCTSLTTAPKLPATTLTVACYSDMFFGCTSLTTAPELPATTLAGSCYQGMFASCTSLTTAPKLPATILEENCYSSMFNKCTALTTAPELPATTLAKYCYWNMFGNCTALINTPKLTTTNLAYGCYSYMFCGCTSLTTAPALSATILSGECYSYMFSDCTSLKTAPELPATSLANYCYWNMFEGCSALTKAPELSASTLADYCYEEMFMGCTSLVTAPKLPATTLAPYCYQKMFSGCTSLINAPELSATTLSKYCYVEMFKGCTSLAIAPKLPATNLVEGGYNYMFSGCTSLVTAPKLPATTIVGYSGMFSGCTSLTTAPELPATTLTNLCYYEMFKGCTSLTKAPVLPAKNLALNCYQYMFSECTSLATAPELPATTLADGCYSKMFLGCTALTTAPELPATTLAGGCYSEVFRGCTSLTKAPVLPAQNLVDQCYQMMFRDCHSLNYVKALFTTMITTPTASYTLFWLSGVSSTGTFVKSKDATWDVTGATGIPSGWTVQTE